MQIAGTGDKQSVGNLKFNTQNSGKLQNPSSNRKSGPVLKTLFPAFFALFATWREEICSIDSNGRRPLLCSSLAWAVKIFNLFARQDAKTPSFLSIA
jgi:hypothetical protein